MANETGRSRITENPLIATLIAQGAETSKTLRGYVGPSTEGYVRLYPNLLNLTECFEVAREDILHTADVPESILPLGAVFLWVKRDARIAVRRSDIAPMAGGVAQRAPDVEVRKGRLRMRIAGRFRQMEDTCASVCSCGTCQSQCTCQSLPVFNPAVNPQR